LRVGFNIGPSDPFWVEVREAAYQRAQQVGLELIPINTNDYSPILSDEEQTTLIEELLGQDLDALIGWLDFPEDLAYHFLDAGVPIVHVTETNVRHPLSVSPLGLYDAAHMLGTYLAERLAGQGQVLVVGGLLRLNLQDDGRSRIAALRDVFRAHPQICWRHIPTAWGYEAGHAQMTAVLQEFSEPIDAIIGLSDSLALAGREAARSLGRLGAHTLVAGINGDPLALAAIAEGSFTATVETSATDLGCRAVDLAQQAAQGLPLPTHFSYKARLVTAQNVAEVAAQKLIAIANLPDRLVGIRRREQQQRLAQLETSLEISRQIGSILDRWQLLREIARLICASYGYEHAQICLWSEAEQRLELDQLEADPARRVRLSLTEAGALGQAVQRNELIFIPDTRRSPRFPQGPDPRWPNTRSRAIVPIQLGDRLLGVLDLHSDRSTKHTRAELVGLQSLAAQLGIAIRNAELYGHALDARAKAEQADRLKTHLLANVSHELRTPLNVILGYTQAALEAPGSQTPSLPAARLKDLQHIHQSAEHLLRVINDLLDLSRAEIDELPLFPEAIETQPFLEDVFHSVRESATPHAEVSWRLEIPSGRLPAIRADPVRLRQILFNLLSNASKFTDRGEIVLGADSMPPHLHLWVQDTGPGIPPDLRERIFEPFVTAHQTRRRTEGIGLGLSITRRLVALHRGAIRLESQPGQGSTFHIYLPLSNSTAPSPAATRASAPPTVLWVSGQDRPPADVVSLSQRLGGEARQLKPGEDLEAALADIHPMAIAWDGAQSGADEWNIIHRLHHQPELLEVPFVLCQESGQDALEPVGLTNILVKPMSGAALLQAVHVLRPPDAVGPVLIVDDDAEVRELYEDLIAKGFPGYPVRTAPDGASALTLMTQVIPSAVVLDLMMPGLDGFEVLDWMRVRPQTRRVPVLVLSGRRLTSDDLQRLEQHALVSYQTKDILTDEELTAALQEVVAGARPTPQPTSALAKRAVAYLQQNYARPLSRAEIARAIGVTENYLTRIFRQELGLALWDYLSRYRILRAKELLGRTNKSVSVVAAEVGFDDPAYFSRVFHRQVGRSPSAYRENPS
jgi:signal transduction histidine kinase/AraC-like DNA-binding protein/ABC-type sugar transport system substrate-binding protein